jgi:hypothetical protein
VEVAARKNEDSGDADAPAPTAADPTGRENDEKK